MGLGIIETSKRILGLPLRVINAAKHRSTWDRFTKTDWSNKTNWSATYSTGDYKSIWDHAYPSPELVGYVLGADLTPGLRVLDLGCGSGEDAMFLANQGFEVYGVDFSRDALQFARRRAKERGLEIDWRECSALDTPFEAGYFDLITDRGCCHHIGGERRREYAQEVARILRPGGKLFLRGCRNEMRPFFPIDIQSIKANFDEQLFEIGPEFVFYLVVDAGGLEATAVTIVRRA